MTKFMKKGMYVLVCALVFAFGLCAVCGEDVFAESALGATIVFEKGEGLGDAGIQASDRV